MDAVERLAQRLGVELRYGDAFGVERLVPRETLRRVCDALGYRAETDAQARAALRHLEQSPPVASRAAEEAARAYQPPPFDDGARAWLLSTQLYAVRSRWNWGMGDFGDLGRLLEAAARLGAAGVGVNPLHALFPDEPERASPYSPSSRLFLNPLYLDPRAIEDAMHCPAADAMMAAPEFRARIAAARDARLVDYAAVAAVKWPLLERLHDRFAAGVEAGTETRRAAEFAAYRRREGAALDAFAVFEVLREELARRDAAFKYWRHWPAEYRRPDSPAVAAFAARHRARVERRVYLQWQADRQLAACADQARASGLPIGLYVDLAVGVDGGGADAWLLQDALVPGFSMGAPPDPWARLGQDWGFPPFNPLSVAAGDDPVFARMLRASMRHAGALRIDHVLGLMRGFWVPHGGTPADGAYVRYPFAALLGLLAAESRRRRCMVIGEDLGTLPEGLRPALRAANVHSSPLLYFEQEDGRFRPPAAYPVEAAAAVTNHDLPTLAGWWSGGDIALRAAVEARRPERRALDERLAERARLVEALGAEGLQVERDEVPTVAVHRFLARTPCRLAVVQLDDAIGEQEQTNLPGTDRERPNWRRKLGLDLQAAVADRRLIGIAAAMAAERRTMPGPRPAAPRRRRPATPVATYRLQLGAGFGFERVREVLPYLDGLGISHVYTSSFLAARPGSAHGYDVVDHNALDPEIGGAEAFDRLGVALDGLDLGLVLDFVPNHMAIAVAANRWWDDVLEWGRASPYADFFDIQWETQKRELVGKVLLPFLGDHYGKVLEKGELVLGFERAAGGFAVRYHEHRFPIRPRHAAMVIERALAELPDALDAERAGKLRDLAAAFARLRPEEQSRRRQVALWCAGRRLGRALGRLADDEATAAFLDRAARLYQGAPGREASFVPLHRLLDRQAWRLAYWRVAADEINYRRFFEIDELAGLRQEVPALFRRCHRLVARLVGQGRLQGLRIDHIDGLADPAGYLAALQRTLAGAAPEARPYVVVEKILEPGEKLPRSWQADGTTGYDFLALVDRLFVLPESMLALRRCHRRFTGDATPFAQLLADCKRLLMDTTLASHLRILVRALDLLSEQHWRTRDFSYARLRLALRETIASLPVYRTYVTGGPPSAADRRTIEQAIAAASRLWRGPDREIFGFIAAALTGALMAPRSGYDRRDALRFILSFQQYTGPVMAKALEDTAFYRYPLLLSLNDVGGDPRVFAVGAEEFHAANRARLEGWPDAMLATATHDTKRGEDARQRIGVLSEIAGEWGEAVARWRDLNHACRADRHGMRIPSAADEYLLYQTLVGAWPPAPTPQAIADLRERVRAYVLKAVREAKAWTSWIDPNEPYESGCQRFVDRILDAGAGHRFLRDFAPFARRVAWLGALGSLSRTALKLTAPGMPDLYQGSELWDLSLVDPDNRRPVDFALRRRLLDDIMPSALPPTPETVRHLLARWPDGAIKLHVTARLLALRGAMPALFARGAYAPLEALGATRRHLVGYARVKDGAAVIVAVGRFFAPLGCGEAAPPQWQDGELVADGLPGGKYLDTLTGRTHDIRAGGSIRAASLFADLPAAVLVAS